MPYFSLFFCFKPLPMRKKLLLYGLCIVMLSHITTVNAQAVNTQDSLALIDLYNSTNGPGWINHTNWLTAAPVSTWFGVTLNSGRVSVLALNNNKLAGTLTSSLGNLSELTILALRQNQLTGNIPATIGNLTKLYGLDVKYNQLGGALPSSLANIIGNAALQLEHNQFTFDGMEYIVSRFGPGTNFPIFNPQGDIALHKNGDVYSVTAGGTLSKNTYKWYRDGILVATKTGDSTYTNSLPGTYGAIVSNAIVTTNPIYHGPGLELSLYSTTNADLQDSIALVDLYNSTNGAGWINNHNWLSQEPLSTWYGVTVRFGKVVMLYLNDNMLTGTIPGSLASLSKLTDFDLGRNVLSGGIAPLARLRSISYIDLSNNQLDGSIPDSLGTAGQLSFLNLTNNKFAGELPATIGSIDYIQTLYLSRNQLSGNIPVGIWRLKHLGGLFLSDNQLTGTIPDAVGKLSELRQLILNNNQLSGSIPDSLTNLTLLSRLNISNNRLTGKIPDSVGRMRNLGEFSLNNNKLSGWVPTSLNNILYLHDLHLQENKFNFNGMETLATAIRRIYSPQAPIPLHRTGNLLSVSAGGTLANNTYTLYRNGTLQTTQSADSSFALNNPGAYYITVTNSVATDLTLSTDTVSVDGLRLTDTSASTTQTISGLAPVNIVDTPYQSLLLSITPVAGTNTLSGEVNFKVTIDPVVKSFNNQPYVQRHYDITPAVNAASAQAIVTLYFTQRDFDNFNATPAHGLDLPTGPADAAGIANLRVYQYHGFSASSLPGGYAGNALEIDPVDAGIRWDAASAYWQVSFAVNGFSGFFVSSINTALLPIKLVSFTGKRQENLVVLQWTTASEINTRYFELQRSPDGNAFTAIATLVAAGNSNANVNYNYHDNAGNAALYYYRLKTVDADGKFFYSKVVKIVRNFSAPAITLLPNPAKDRVVLRLPLALQGSTVVINNMGGQTVKTIFIPAGTTQLTLNLHGLAQGLYSVVYQQGGKVLNANLVVE
jgi:Leucine-rich repeat (LRR) protein